MSQKQNKQKSENFTQQYFKEWEKVNRAEKLLETLFTGKCVIQNEQYPKILIHTHSINSMELNILFYLDRGGWEVSISSLDRENVLIELSLLEDKLKLIEGKTKCQN